MVKKEVTLTNPSGLHARPAALFAKAASEFKDTTINVTHNQRTINAKSIISVMSLGAKKDSTVTLCADGPEEVQAVFALSSLIEGGFGEN